MYAPRIFMMIRPQFNPAKIAKGIDVRYYIDRYGYACAQERAWMDVVGVMYEELENYLSASGTAEDILKELKHKSRRMKISHLEDGYRMGNLNGGAGAEIFERNESLGVTFFHSAGYIYEPKLGPQLLWQRQCCGIHCGVIQGLPDYRRQIQEQLPCSITTWTLWNRTHKR